MLLLPKDVRDSLVNYLANSMLPSREVQQLIQVLNGLAEQEEKKEEAAGNE